MTPLGEAARTFFLRWAKSAILVALPLLIFTRPELGVRISSLLTRRLGHCRPAELTEIIGLLKVLVDNTTAHDLAHVGRVEGSGLIKGSLSSSTGKIAPILGEKDGDRIVLEGLDETVISGFLKITRTAPRVDVVAKEVDGLVGITAVEVGRKVITDVGVVVGSIANAHPSVVLVRDVLLCVPDGSFDVGRRTSVVGLVADLVASEKAENIGISSHGIDDRLVVVEKLHVPRGIAAVNRKARLAEVGNDVDAGIIEQLHANGVVRGGIDGVCSDDVGTELGE